MSSSFEIAFSEIPGRGGQDSDDRYNLWLIWTAILSFLEPMNARELVNTSQDNYVTWEYTLIRLYWRAELDSSYASSETFSSSLYEGEVVGGLNELD